jgi:hypothetical protein
MAKIGIIEIELNSAAAGNAEKSAYPMQNQDFARNPSRYNTLGR